MLEKKIVEVMSKVSKGYLITLLACMTLAGIAGILWLNQIISGMHLSGKNNPVGWFMYITNFVFWVGIAHSGTLISAVLYLFRSKFRCRCNRAAEAMTVISIMIAGLFPIIHLGKPWLFYWLIPYPNQRELWINFKSPLIWDVFAVGTYFTVSLIFFYVGMIPDFAILKKFFSGIRSKIYELLSIGFTGTLKQWSYYNTLYMLLASFATPLVVSVHSVVSWDFAMSLLPGWHTTIFAPYFVAGAIFSGSAMVITLTYLMRKFLKLEDILNIDMFEKLSKILLFTSLIVTYAYIVEILLAFSHHNVYEIELFKYRLTGDFKILFYLMILFNSILPLTLFFEKFRRNINYLFILSILVNIGMWLERFVIIVTSLARSYNPYSWGLPVFSWTALGITLGSFGLFFTMYLLFIKLLPPVSICELKEHEN
ncbi:MAG: polysulfide reductase NrfD [bacterium]|nr:polysulfide reductase NrfD [bacterium]